MRFVAFPNEEPPFFDEGGMGSEAFARRPREGDERVVAMLSLETLGCYSDVEGSQRYPLAPLAWLYPTRGDFVAFVGDLSSRQILRSAVRAFREGAAFTSEGACLPRGVPGVGWSDHRSFWCEGYPAVMVTDTALFRDPRYHSARDLPAAVDHERLARVVEGVERVLIAWTAP